MRFDRSSLVLLLVLPFAGCASSGVASKPAAATPVDLAAARAAVEDARRAGAARSAKETFRQAEKQLKEAEALREKGGLTADKAQRAELLGRLAAAEARCSAALPASPSRTAGDKPRPRDDADLASRLRRAEDEKRRLEERVALLQREVELTETEVLRTKARLQGIETKAEASSAIAEARILVGRLDPKDKATSTRCQELLSKAEQQINENNFGAAVFFARKAQEIATKPRDPSLP